MSLPDQYRNQAKAQREAANALITEKQDQLIKQTPTGFDCKNLVTVLVGHTTANTLEAVADSMDYLAKTASQETLMNHAARVLDRNAQIRNAAALAVSTGNWDEFDRLASGTIGSGSTEGNGG